MVNIFFSFNMKILWIKVCYKNVVLQSVLSLHQNLYMYSVNYSIESNIFSFVL